MEVESYLFQVAKKRGERIVAVNHRLDAYSPSDRIMFPDYEKEFENLKWNSPAPVVKEVLGSQEKWAEEFSFPIVLKDNSFYTVWVNLQGEEVSSDETGEESGQCTEFGIDYDLLVKKIKKVFYYMIVFVNM